MCLENLIIYNCVKDIFEAFVFRLKSDEISKNKVLIFVCSVFFSNVLYKKKKKERDFLKCYN